MGTLLFLIYIHGLPYGIYHTAKLVVYANDTSELITGKNINEFQIKAKTVLDYMSEWILVNGLTLNIYKTNIVKFSSKHYQDKTFLINYQNHSIKESSNTKFLRLELGKHINWKNYMNNVLPKLNSACFLV